MWCGGFLLGSAVLSGLADGQALRVLVLGDSMTEEYHFELPFSAPDSNPTNPNTKNWVEILGARRDAEINLGSYKSSLPPYPDLRNMGYKFNYGVPSFKTTDWIAVINSSLSLDPVVLLRYRTKTQLLDHLDEVDVVVIFLGGNDLKSDYSGIFNNPEPPTLLDQTVANLAILHDFIRIHAPAFLPIVIATAPDIGASPDVLNKYTDPDKRLVARARIANMNTALAAMAVARGATVARIDQLTDRVFDQVPLHLNGTIFSLVPNKDNPPHAAFCKDGFHPATMPQALIADILIDALNRATGRAVPRLSNREILLSILGLNPEQPYLDWAAGAGDISADPDGDGMPNLTEYAMGTSPLSAGSPYNFTTGGTMGFAVSAAGLRYATLAVEETTTLTSWLPVPSSRITMLPDDTWRIQPSGSARTFYRLAVTPRP
jgi:lysophospholipase L1-like esterase